ncbi:MAG: VWA domain-containing protein [Pyrinomonadaceae bacterium]
MTAQTEQGIRIDLPADGHVRIENQFGAVETEVWNERYVLVSATIERGATFRRSPVVIQNRNRLLLVSIVRTPVDPAVTILLTVKIPSSAHAEIVTGGGSIALSGLPAAASMRSVSGDIRAELSHPLNADIDARSASGAIRSELEAPLGDGGHVLRTRLGAGERVLRINTGTGQITLLVSEQPNRAEVTQQTAPALVGRESNSPGAGTPANGAQSEEVSEGDVVRVDSQLVTLNISVIDRNTNRGLLGLSQPDFRLLEDGAEQRIVQFDSASAPFDLMLLIDLSGSTRDVVKLIRQAALRFVQAARPSDRIGIITFAGQPTLVSPVTLDRQRLQEAIDTIGTPSGDTKLYDATDFALTKIVGDKRSSRRTAIVLMSDGLDGTVPGVSGQQGSKLSYKELLSRIQEFDGVLYSLWLNTYYEALNPKDTQPEAFDTAHDQMKEIAETGGGTFYEVERLEDLAGAYERVVADLGTVYSLAYRPSNKSRDGKWRSIRVNVNRPSAIARGKRGYYAN